MGKTAIRMQLRGEGRKWEASGSEREMLFDLYHRGELPQQVLGSPEVPPSDKVALRAIYERGELPKRDLIRRFKVREGSESTKLRSSNQSTLALATR